MALLFFVVAAKNGDFADFQIKLNNEKYHLTKEHQYLPNIQRLGQGEYIGLGLNNSIMDSNTLFMTQMTWPGPQPVIFNGSERLNRYYIENHIGQKQIWRYS